MGHVSKILVGIAVLVGVLFLVTKIFDINLFSKEVCPKDECTFSTDATAEGSLAVKTEDGRTREDFSTIPSDFPKDLPVDKNPVKVLESYKETVEASPEDPFSAHTQSLYSYVSKESANTIATKFETYLKKNGFTVTKSINTVGQISYSVFARKVLEKTTNQVISVTVTNQSQTEPVVMISMIQNTISQNP
jgi:hypothetical protein